MDEGAGRGEGVGRGEGETEEAASESVSVPSAAGEGGCGVPSADGGPSSALEAAERRGEAAAGLGLRPKERLRLFSRTARGTQRGGQAN